jgi:hypothetical protein
MNKKAIFKFVVIIILGVVVASAAISTGVMADTPVESDYSDILNDTDGDGTSSNPHVVTNLDELQAVQGDLSADYVLDNNIDASETVLWNSGAGFTPIGKYGDPFSGEFDGKGFSVDGLYINRPNTDEIGLFGHVNSADIKNIGVTNLDIEGDNNVGGLVGSTRGSIITNSFSSGSVSGYRPVGGLVGVNKNTKIETSYSNSNVSGSYKVGGLVGFTEGGANIMNSYSSGNVSGDILGVGGLVGVNKNTTIETSYSNSNVSGDSQVGGLVGTNKASSNILRTYSTGVVSGDGFVGGLVGFSEGANITNSYSSGNVSGSNWVGGLVGNNKDANIMNSYSSGNVSGGASLGGLVGANNDGTVTDSYWDTETSTQATSAGSANGLTTAEITGSAASTNMVGFDFTTVWSTVSASDADSSADLYPIIQRYETPTTYSVDVLVEDSEGTAISGATVEIDGQTLTTNSTVRALLTLTEGTYNYTISKDGHYTISDTVIVNSDTTLDSVLNQYEYDINVTVLDELQEGLSNAKVTFQGQEYQTYSDGNLTLVGTSNESYNITADKDKYVSSTQSITIEDSPTTLTYTLDYKLGDIEGNVTDDSGNPIENTSVTLDTLKTTQTDSTGFYRFDNLLVGEYDLGFEADGYNSIAQSVTVQNDTVTTNDVTLQSNSTTDDEDGTTDGAIGVDIVVDEYRIVENQEANLKAELSGAKADEVSFEWFVSGESFGGDKQSIDYFFDDDGDYRVSVRVTEDATGDIVEGNLSLDEEDWTEDREIIFTDLIVKTYNDAGNPINATVNVLGDGSPYYKVGHTTEWQVNAAYNATAYAADYTNCDCVARNAPRDSPGWEKYREKYVRNNEWKIYAKKTVNMSVAEGEPKTLELTLTTISVPSSGGVPDVDGGVPDVDGGGDGDGDEDNPNYPEDNGVGGVLIGDGGVPDGDGDGGISAAITLSILAAAALVIIIGGFWLFKLLAAVLGIDGGTNGLGRILRGEDD